MVHDRDVHQSPPMLLVLPLVALMSCKKDAVTPGVQADCPRRTTSSDTRIRMATASG